MKASGIATTLFLFSAGAVFAATPAWVEKSNRNADVLLRVTARFSPEGAADIGVDGLDDQILDLQPKRLERVVQAYDDAEKELKSRAAKETDPLVKQDLDLLFDAIRRNKRTAELAEKYPTPYMNLSGVIFYGMRTLLDDQIAPERRAKALVRLRRYAGLEEGFTPAATLAEARMREHMAKPNVRWPIRAEVEKELTTSAFLVDGAGKLFEKYKLAGYQEPLETLRRQIEGYNAFIRREVLPKARDDFREPAEVYENNVANYGIDIPVVDVAKMAHTAFSDLQKQMQELAPVVAKKMGIDSTDYRDVIRTLKQDQLTGDAILPHYQKRLAEIEQIIQREKLATLPDRPARIRIASAAESAALPAPNMRPPRMVNNHGESGEFILPLNAPTSSGAMQKLDDFTFAAASWTLTSHEARPGHEMQFAAMIENGVSNARGVFAFNSTNVEGWGLYAEYIMFPFMPPEGQLISLQHRMMRAARAFLDPELQMGKVTKEQAMRVLKDEVMLSDAMATQEVERYTFRSPGQAVSYFYGYTRLLELRRDAEKAMGAKFDEKKFHDFVLSQGLLPPGMLRKAVFMSYVK